jgi:Fic family protein
MQGLEEFAARADLDPIQRALLVHLEFVTIHPFHDGNGRIGRLLGNLSLLSSGLPWVTIRADERIPFFRSLEQAQVFNNTVPFISFLWHLIKQSVSELASNKGRSRRRR